MFVLFAVKTVHSTAAGSFYLLNNALITVKEQQIIQIKFWKNNTNT